MDLARFPRRRYTAGATPIEYLQHLTKELDGPQIYMKRDDLLGGAGGGNKTRKLEFVVADAMAKGADTLITCGAPQSNHCRLTLSAAVKEGLKCRLVLEEREAGSFDPRASGNNLLYRLMDVDKITVVPPGTDLMAAMEEEAKEVRAKGGEPYLIPVGASDKIGALGYAACAEEMLAQLFNMGLAIDKVITPSGSAGTQAGLIAGFWGNSSSIQVVGMNVSRGKEEQEPVVYDLTRQTAELLGINRELPKEAALCFGDYVGPGYSLPTEGMVEAVKMLAGKEAVLLDPVYTGKTMAGLIDLCRKGYFKKDEKILFLHTGGSPALYVYKDLFLA
jgi:D-cysteine desulfhydrase